VGGENAAMTPEAIAAVADAFFAAIEAGDRAAVAAFYRSDSVVWHNTDQLTQGRDENLVVLGRLIGHFAQRHYSEIQRVIIDGGFVQQHVLRLRTVAGGEAAIPAMMRVWVEDGAIVRIDEYLDSRQVDQLRSLP
jgi:ketosteroid isomerase-like protein